jgi:2-polyprenyl-6-methoxyphenol hydroxylase-like FAD-dependent oxidoreductase
MKTETKILIIGAGIGGLATAIALQKAGFQTALYERAPALRGIGAGISLWSNATAVLKKLDLLDEAVSKGQVYDGLEVKNRRGELLMRSDVGGRATPAICLHRADLIDLLERNCAPGTIHPGKTIERFEQSETGVKAFFDDGETATGDVLIGADGINSRVRAQIKGDAKPVYRGYVIWRGVVDFNASGFSVKNPSETWGTGNRFGLVPIGKNRFYWYATNNQPENTILSPEKRKAQLSSFFQDWHAPIPQIIAATAAENILQNDCYDRSPERGWSSGRVCLIGDAAHPTTPNMGQGGCLALEDAIVLTKCLQKAASHGAAFHEFENSRFPRAKFINRRSLMFGRIGQWKNGLAVGLRDVLTKNTPAKSLERSLASVYDYET